MSNKDQISDPPEIDVHVGDSADTMPESEAEALLAADQAHKSRIPIVEAQ